MGMCVVFQSAAPPLCLSWAQQHTHFRRRMPAVAGLWDLLKKTKTQRSFSVSYGVRCTVYGVRCQVSGVRFQVSGLRSNCVEFDMSV